MLDNRCGCPAPISFLAREAQRASSGFRVFSKQIGMVMLGNIPATGIGLFSGCQQLVPGVEAVGAVTPGVTQTMRLPADTSIDGKFVDRLGRGKHECAHGCVILSFR